MVDKKELPIVIPTVTAYHRVSFAMAILMANFKYDFCINNYINIYMNPDYIKNNDDTFLGFEKTDIDEIEEFEIGAVNKNEIEFEYVISSINNGKYLFFSNINEKYIKNARYEGIDFPHNILVYGYNKCDGTISVMGYDKTTKMALYKTDFESLKQSCNSIFGQTQINEISVRSQKETFIDLELIKSSIRNYLDSRPYIDKFTENKIYGHDAILYLIHYLKCVEAGIYDKSKFDLKMFRLISDHKQLMRKRLQVLSEMESSFSELNDELTDIIAIAEKVRALSLKFFASGKEMLLQNMQKYLNGMIEKERTLYSKILEELDKMLLKNDLNTNICLNNYVE